MKKRNFISLLLASPLLAWFKKPSYEMAYGVGVATNKGEQLKEWEIDCEILHGEGALKSYTAEELGAYWQPMTLETMKKIVKGPVKHINFGCVLVADPRKLT